MNRKYEITDQTHPDQPSRCRNECEFVAACSLLYNAQPISQLGWGVWAGRDRTKARCRECERPAHSRGFCGKHYKTARRAEADA